ncbi:hypothetical protein IM697_40385 [Streptomyces ferrugineus]|uniref:Uncharacterized protein n=1 Tax=Streptomyces ferrugineus TaxID=1413221 RepID=A0A7M2SKH8_9ACTN|nr:hypothetical protein [Streptomyces ferrugineus]QOV36205.1 hypothetical protein IM697_40385 [Streptomyces ferrugineus]
MSASGNASENASQHKDPQRPRVVAGVSMRDLLAAGAAANMISTPPRAPEAGQPVDRRREAA